MELSIYNAPPLFYKLFNKKKGKKMFALQILNVYEVNENKLNLQNLYIIHHYLMQLQYFEINNPNPTAVYDTP
jgi:hypothetical protein